ncbi:MAG: 4Fe-4S dicluster domain-containing protein [Myxococcales bacterium]|nr:4Fe-4S dicluster domain-containing protein [Myxococcales bacterium]
MHLTLPPATAARLGPEGTARALAVRKQLAEAGIALPAWIDERPGRLQLVVGDLADDPPLSRSAEVLATEHGPWVLAGLLALQTAAAAPRAAFYVPDGAALGTLSRLVSGMAVEVHRALPSWPSQPERDIPGAFGRAWVASPAVLDRAAAALSGEPPRRVCTVAGGVRRPQAMCTAPGETVRDLVRRAGGALVADWVALCGGAPGGTLCARDEPPPAGTALVLVLSAAHPLVRQARRPLSEGLARARTACLGCRQCSDVCPEAARGTSLRPHHLVAQLAQGRADPALAEALLCTGCGACDLVCPAAVGPAGILRHLSARLASAGASPPRQPLRDHPARPAVRLPRDRLLQQLGLSQYR